MIPPIAVITLRKEPAYRRAAFETGLRRLGYFIAVNNRVDQGAPAQFPRGPQDLLVLWNKKRGADEKAADRWEAAGGTVIVTENAYLQKTDKSMYAISTHGHNGSGWFPFDRTEDRFTPLGFPIKDWRRGGHFDLVCGQRGIGSSLMASPPQWGEKKVKQLGREGRPARLRAHPGNFAPKVPLLHDLEGAAWCRVWSSSAGVVALLEGVNVEHDAPHWICGGQAGQSREEALNYMAHGQWSVAEIESGEPFARMRAENWGPRW